MGTFGWTIRGAPDPREGDFSASYNHQEGDESGTTTVPRGGHFDPRNFSSLGPRVPVEVREVKSASRGFRPQHRFNIFQPHKVL